MGSTMHLLEQVSLQGLDVAPSQIWGAMRIVPLLRRNVQHDLRLDRRDYRDELVYRLERAGFGYILNEQVRQQARKKAR